MVAQRAARTVDLRVGYSADQKAVPWAAHSVAVLVAPRAALTVVSKAAQKVWRSAAS